ncbi:hypothetical protein Q5P01_011398 [Channa striata]|uniref:TNFR-Cys domain-containing protein n=1 Tax=Channa striata TaxID=64152 RepID=A0AA88SVM4_CHASR|nr:hypothetical protein Q5P01_011398 [Channa striata]
MQPLYIIFTVLSSLCFFSSVLSIECNETHYQWPVNEPRLCCNKCAPGQHMVRRPENSCGVTCNSCTGNRYTDSYNVYMTCNSCTTCNKPNMKFLSQCNTTHNAVCTCTAGYKCKDQPCTQCEAISAPTEPTLLLSTTILTTTWKSESINDTASLLVIIALLCAVIAFAIATNIKPFLCWIRSKHGYFLTQKPAPESQFSEDEDVSKPVQEVCGKCDQPIDV